MNKSIYSLTGANTSQLVLTPDQLPICQQPNAPGTLSALQLTIYINRANALLNETAITRPPIDNVLNRLDVIRQEICVLTGRAFRPLPPPPEVGTTTDTTGKITMSSVLT